MDLCQISQWFVFRSKAKHQVLQAPNSALPVSSASTKHSTHGMAKHGRYPGSGRPCKKRMTYLIFEGSLEVKLPTIWTDEKQSRAEAERRERLEERRSEKRKSQKKEDADARKGRKVATRCVFPMICGSGWSKSRLAKAAGAEPAGQMRR